MKRRLCSFDDVVNNDNHGLIRARVVDSPIFGLPEDILFNYLFRHILSKWIVPDYFKEDDPDSTYSHMFCYGCLLDLYCLTITCKHFYNLYDCKRLRVDYLDFMHSEYLRKFEEKYHGEDDFCVQFQDVNRAYVLPPALSKSTIILKQKQ
jgi:hypothetical protein